MTESFFTAVILASVMYTLILSVVYLRPGTPQFDQVGPLNRRMLRYISILAAPLAMAPYVVKAGDPLDRFLVFNFTALALPNIGIALFYMRPRAISQPVPYAAAWKLILAGSIGALLMSILLPFVL